MPIADAETDGVAERDAVREGAALDGEGDVLGDALGLVEGDGEDEGEDEVLGVAAEGDAVLGVTSGMLCRTSSGPAVSRVGVACENAPLTMPATATTPTTAATAAARSRARRGRRRGSSAAGGESPGASVAGPGAGPGVGSGTARNGTVGCATTGSGSVSPPSAPTPAPVPDSMSMYGRIRSGSKSSAAACSAVRASRSASDVRWLQSQEGEPSGSFGAPHSGH
ncbi:hypothetical protein ACGF3G_28755 [Streptomyces sp. NPDC048179]|uniref:hypothetical protein n=1 Tax=Streptomyces sp. NPDC048179 TaxID=3365506 RepID=UPI003715078E